MYLILHLLAKRRIPFFKGAHFQQVGDLGSSAPILNYSQAVSSKRKPGKDYIKRTGHTSSEVPRQQGFICAMM
jgi:hypothetical protein